MGLTIRPTDRILIVAPHPDDESIGCGGIISLYPRQTDVLLVTDGYSETLKNREISEIRKQEFRRAMETAQIHTCIMLHIPEHTIGKNRKLFKNVDFNAYTHVFVPNRYEDHIDHRAVYRTVKRLTGRKGNLYEYEVWTTLRKPNVYVDITAVVGQKKALIGCHQSQVKDLDYEALALGLNTYRGQTKNMRCAEAFYCAKERKGKARRDFKRKIKKILHR